MSLALPSTSASRANISGTVLDALPYIDDVNYTESHRQLAIQLIEAECRNFPLTKNYLRHLAEPKYEKFLSPRILEQYAKIAEKKELEKIDMKRYEVPAPTGAKLNDKRSWQSAIQNCKSQLGNQHLRKLNLEIMEEYGPEAYLQFNKELQKIVDVEEAQVTKLRNQLYEVNARRKRSQLLAGEQLTNMGKNWVELISKNARMEVALINLEKEIDEKAKRLCVDPGIKKE